MRCPSCNTWVEEDAATCWMCQRVIRPDLLAEGEAGFDPGPPAAATVGRRRSLVSTLIIVFGVLVVAAGAAFTIVWFVDSGGEEIVDEYVAGDRGVEYTSEEGLFTATFPTEPSEQDLDLNIDLAIENGGMVDSKPGSAYVFEVAWLEIPISLPADIINQLGLEAAKEVGGEIEAVNQRDLTYAPATEMVITNDDETYWLLAFEAQNRLYAVQVASENDERAPFEHFVSSLRLTSPSTETQS